MGGEIIKMVDKYPLETKNLDHPGECPFNHLDK